MSKKQVCTGDHADHELHAIVTEHLLDGDTALRLASLFKALSDPTRARIIGLLAHTEMCVGDLCRALGMAQPAVSHQLRHLRQTNLVTMQRSGQHVIYTLADEHIHTLFHQGLSHVQED